MRNALPHKRVSNFESIFTLAGIILMLHFYYCWVIFLNTSNTLNHAMGQVITSYNMREDALTSM